MSRTQRSSIGRALGPLSPPTMTHEIPSRHSVPTWPRSGSIEREANSHGRHLQVSYPSRGDVILDGYAAPDVRRRRRAAVPAEQVVLHERASLCEYLKDMAVGSFHGVENLIDEVDGYLPVKEIAHRVDEHPARPSP